MEPAVSDSFRHARENARPDCPKCKGAGSYMYDHNHGTICDLCCKHDHGFWQLKKHYGQNNDKWCCLAGCGFVVEFDPDDFMGPPVPVLGPKAREALGRPDNYNELSPREQWEWDKLWGLLDWDGDPLK